MQRTSELAQKTELTFQAERQASVSTRWALRCPLLACVQSPSRIKLDINGKRRLGVLVVYLLSSLPSSQIRGVSVGLAACGFWRYKAGPTWTDWISQTRTYTHIFVCVCPPSDVLSCWEVVSFLLLYFSGWCTIILGSALFPHSCSHSSVYFIMLVTMSVSFLRFSEDTSRQTEPRGLHFPTSVTPAHKRAQRWPRRPHQQWR